MPKSDTTHSQTQIFDPPLEARTLGAFESPVNGVLVPLSIRESRTATILYDTALVLAIALHFAMLCGLRDYRQRRQIRSASRQRAEFLRFGPTRFPRLGTTGGALLSVRRRAQEWSAGVKIR